MSNLTPDGGGGLNLGNHITAAPGQASSSTAAPSALWAWCMIIGALLLLMVAGVGLRKVRI